MQRALRGRAKWGPNRVFGKTEDYGFLSVKKMKT